MKTDQEQSNPVNFSRVFARRCFLFNVFIVTYELRLPQPLTYDYHQWANGSVWRCPHAKLLHFLPWIFLYLPPWTVIIPPSNISNVSLSIGPHPSHASSLHSSPSLSQLLSPRNPEAGASTHRSQLLLYYLWTCHLNTTLFLFRLLFICENLSHALYVLLLPITSVPRSFMPQSSPLYFTAHFY